MITFDHNWIAILVAAVVNMAIGAGWYGYFAEPWMEGNGFTREQIEAGPHSIWRYRPFLPVTTDQPIDVGTGMTPLLKANRLAQRLGLQELYVKNDAVNIWHP